MSRPGDSLLHDEVSPVLGWLGDTHLKLGHETLRDGPEQDKGVGPGEGAIIDYPPRGEDGILLHHHLPAEVGREPAVFLPREALCQAKAGLGLSDETATQQKHGLLREQHQLPFPTDGWADFTHTCKTIPPPKPPRVDDARAVEGVTPDSPRAAEAAEARERAVDESEEGTRSSS